MENCSVGNVSLMRRGCDGVTYWDRSCDFGLLQDLVNMR